MSEIFEQTRKGLELLGLKDYTEGGRYFQLSCPFWKQLHGKPDKNPSFVIYPEYGKDNAGVAKCYSCHYKSSLVDFLNNYAIYINKDINFDFLNFYVFLNFENEAAPENPILDEAIFDGFSKNAAPIIKYLSSRDEPIDFRHLDVKMYYDDIFKNIVSPVRNFEGNLVGATSRHVGNKGNKSHHYFGFSTSLSLLGHEQHDKSNVLIVEGMTDYLNCKAKINQLNLDYNVMATLTCAMSDWQARNLIDLGKKLFMCWDMDAAGQKARPQAIQKLQDALKVYDVSWGYKNKHNKIKDVGDFTTEEFLETFG